MNSISMNVVSSNQPICISNILNQKRRKPENEVVNAMSKKQEDASLFLSKSEPLHHQMKDQKKLCNCLNEIKLVYQQRKTRMASKIYYGLLQICLYFCRSPPPFNSTNNCKHSKIIYLTASYIKPY